MVEHRLDPRLQLPSTRRIECVMQPVEFSKGGIGGLDSNAQCCLVVAGEETPIVAQSGRHDVENRARHILGNLLFEPSDRNPPLPNDAAAIWGDSAVQELHERTFARAVPPQEADAFTPFDGEARPVEYTRAAKGDRYILHCQQRHPTSPRS